jgi:hypothetical protein
VQVHYGEGVANHADPESCAAYRQVCGVALTWERAGQPLSARTVLRGRRPWHVRTLLVWEPGDLQFDH